MKYAKKLEDMGIPKEQAEAQVTILAEIMEGTLATKLDLLALRNEFKEELAKFRDEVTEKINTLRNEVKEEINALRNEVREEIHTLRNEVREELAVFRGEVNKEINELRTDFERLRAEFINFENRIIIKIGIMLGGFSTIVVSVLALIFRH